MVSIAKMREQLLEGFPEPQADLMARVFVSAHEELVTKAELNELTAVVREIAEYQRQTDEKMGALADAQKRTDEKMGALADAQNRTDEKMGALADAQKRTDEKMGALADAQKRTDERMGVLADAQKRTDEKMGALADAQKRTDEKVGLLADAQRRTEWAVKDLAKQVGGLSAALGGSLEDFACDLVPELLEKYWAMDVESAAPEDVTVGDGPREVDVVVRGRIGGRPVAVFCETKATVSVKEVKRFLRLVARLKDARPTDDIRPLFFGYKANREARDLIVTSGAAMVFTRGVMIPAPSENRPVGP